MFPKDIAYPVAINLSNLLNSSSRNLSKWEAGVEKMWTWFFPCSQLVGKFSRWEHGNQPRGQRIISTGCHDKERLIEHAKFYHIIYTRNAVQFSVYLSSILRICQSLCFWCWVRRIIAVTNSRSFSSDVFYQEFYSFRSFVQVFNSFEWMFVYFCHFLLSSICVACRQLST